MRNKIYKHTNKINGKSYIGKTKNKVDYRLNQHIRSSNNGSNNVFHRALRKYGIDNFETSILEDNISDENIDIREEYWIKYYNTFNNGYNMTIGGDGGDTISKIHDFTPTKNFGSDNGRARTITIYDNNHNIIAECNGDYVKKSKDIGICYTNIKKSADNYGMPIYNKRDKKTNGYYCVDSKIGIDSTKWLYSYCIKNKDDNIIYNIINGYKLSDFIKDNNLPNGLLKARKDKRLYSKCRPNDIIKHQKSGNIKYIGWYIEKCQ